MKILVVDDDRFNLRVARDIITANVDHAGVLICDKPETVMELLATENIGVILPGIAFGLLKKHGGDLWADSDIIHDPVAAFWRDGVRNRRVDCRGEKNDGKKECRIVCR